MPYPRELINPHEELILELHPHWWYFAKSVALVVLSTIIGLWVMNQNWWGFTKVIAALFILASLGYLLERYIRWASTYFVLTTDRVIWRSGVVSKRGIEIPLERINTVFFQQRIFERLLGLGDLEIESASKDGAQRFEDIRKPSAVQNEIYRQMEENENRKFDRVSQGIQVAQGVPTVPEQIEQLARLRDQGILSEEEFQAKKAELLDRM
ncbi:MAG: PH domain-containing protein [Acidimicrobiales bacterium]|nr:PH domain-containing protein [Acidimicrobiales bacterium]